jgi:hypothetical protein
MFLDIKPEMTARMPRWKGDLELINHSAGSLTSQAYHKRWNRKNELLADAAEKASLAAAWLRFGRPYPQKRLNDAWTLVMGGHFHDTGAGTATPRSYEFAWNDDVIAMNQFAGILTDATQNVASALDTRTNGTSVVIFNPLNIEREDVVEANVALPAGTKGVRVTGPDGKQVPAQVEGEKVLFLARAPSAGYAVFDVEPAAEAMTSALKVNVRVGGRGAGGRGAANAPPTSLENDRYRVTLDNNGPRTALRADSAGDFERPSGAMAGLEYGFRAGAGGASRVRPRRCRGAHQRERRGARHGGSHSHQYGGLALRLHGQPLRGRRRQSRRVRRIDRLADALLQPESHVPSRRQQ